MQVIIEGKELVIRIPVETPPRPSKSGKSLIVATSNDAQEQAEYQGAGHFGHHQE